MSSLRFGRLSVDTSNLDKVFFPDSGVTKGDLITYYTEVADVMLPHLRDRPLSFQRFPNGIEASGFFQKDRPTHYPEWIATTPVPKKGGENQQVVVENAASLAYLANNGVVTLHGALSRAPTIDKPDRLIFDLDPSVDDFDLVRRAARVTRDVLDDIGLPVFLQTTGSRGLHVVVPIRPEHDFEVIGGLARALAEQVVARDPDSFTIERLKRNRGDRLLIDYFRNAYAQTAVVPYSVRAKPGAPVATPIEWDELARLRKGAASFTIADIPRRLARRGDPWRNINRRARSLTKLLARLDITG